MRSWLWSKIKRHLPRIVDSTQVNHAVVGHDKPWYFSERRFLVFGRKGPWELVIKPSHVGISAMVFSGFIFALGYLSVQTINTAFTVANQELISPADASLIAMQKPSIETEKSKESSVEVAIEPELGPLINKFSVKNYLFLKKVRDLENFMRLEKSEKQIGKWHDQPLEAVNEDFQLSKEIADTKIFRHQMLSSFEMKEPNIKHQEIQIVFNVPNLERNYTSQKTFSELNANSGAYVPSVSGLDKQLGEQPLIDTPVKTGNEEQNVQPAKNKELKTISQNILGPNDMPTLMDEKVRGARFLKSIDREINVIESVFEQLGIKLAIPESAQITPANLIWPMHPGSSDYLEYMRKQFIKLDVYRDALASLPLHSPLKYYYISSKYGKRKHPVTKKWAMHHGIDLAGTWQEKVRATADGTVIFSGWEGSFGRVVRVQHRFGIQTIYAHLASLKVKRGDYITSGDVLGSMGSSGRSDGAHLHYEIRINNASKNPKKFFDVGQSLLSPSSLRLSAF